MLLQANDYLWLHDHLGCEIQIGGSDQWGNIIVRRRPDPAQASARPSTPSPGRCCSPPTARSSARPPAPARGSTRPRPVPYQFRQHWLQIGDDEIRAQLLMFSLRPVDELEALLDGARRGAPRAGRPSGRWRDEMTELVHGEEAARAADEAADVLFGGDPTTASEAALDAVAREVPSSRRSAAELDDLVDLLVATGLASSKGDARRTLDGQGYRANGVPIDADLGSGGDRAAPRPLPAAPAGQEVAPPRRGFLLTRVVAPVGERLTYTSASRTVPGPAGNGTEPSFGTCHELRLLENGREDRTPVRAVRRADPRVGMTRCLSILLPASRSAATRIRPGFPAGRRMQSRNRVAAKRSGTVCSKHDRARLAGTGS